MEWPDFEKLPRICIDVKIDQPDTVMIEKIVKYFKCSANREMAGILFNKIIARLRQLPQELCNKMENASSWAVYYHFLWNTQRETQEFFWRASIFREIARVVYGSGENCFQEIAHELERIAEQLEVLAKSVLSCKQPEFPEEKKAEALWLQEFQQQELFALRLLMRFNIIIQDADAQDSSYALRYLLDGQKELENSVEESLEDSVNFWSQFMNGALETSEADVFWIGREVLYLLDRWNQDDPIFNQDRKKALLQKSYNALREVSSATASKLLKVIDFLEPNSKKELSTGSSCQKELKAIKNFLIKVRRNQIEEKIQDLTLCCQTAVNYVDELIFYKELNTEDTQKQLAWIIKFLINLDVFKGKAEKISSLAKSIPLNLRIPKVIDERKSFGNQGNRFLSPLKNFYTRLVGLLSRNRLEDNRTVPSVLGSTTVREKLAFFQAFEQFLFCIFDDEIDDVKNLLKLILTSRQDQITLLLSSNPSPASILKKLSQGLSQTEKKLIEYGYRKNKLFLKTNPRVSDLMLWRERL